MANFTERHEHKIEIIPPYSILQCRRADIIEKDGVEVLLLAQDTALEVIWWCKQ